LTRPHETLGAVLLASLVALGATGCGGVSYVSGPPTLGRYHGSGATGSVAIHDGRLDPKDGVVGRGTYGDYYAFFGHEDERLVVTLSSDDLDCYVLVVDGAGRVLAEDDDSGGGLDSALEVRLPADGLYLVVATSYAREVGSYQLRVSRPGGEAAYPHLALPAELRRRFTSPGPADGSGNPYHVYALDVQGGRELSVHLSSGQVDALLRLYDSDGNEVAMDDDSGGDLDAHLVYMPAGDGRYYLVATTYMPPRPFGEASYRLVVTQ
jgi:hypothetical protein